MEIQSAVTQTKVSQALLSPPDTLQMLKEGNQRFVSQRPLRRNYLTQVDDTSGGQYPFAAVVSCIDSRIPTEIVLDQGIGDIFNVRIAGNFVNSDILGSLEFATMVAGAKLVLVMGHTACGAIKGACDDAKLGNLTGMLEKIKPAVEAVETPEGVDRSSKNSVFVDEVARKNVELTIKRLLQDSDVMRDLHAQGKLIVAGAMYDVASGRIDFVTDHHPLA